jgi:GxxExxY protein
MVMKKAGLPEEIEAVAEKIIDACFRIHKALGPGLLESVYEECLCYELSRAGLEFKRQVSLPVVYESIKLDAGMRLDLIVASAAIVELKAVEDLTPLHHAQLLTYLKLTGLRLGLLVNFNVPIIKSGIKRLIL